MNEIIFVVLICIICMIVGWFSACIWKTYKCRGELIIHSGEIYLNVSRKDFDVIEHGKDFITIRIRRG